MLANRVRMSVMSDVQAISLIDATWWADGWYARTDGGVMDNVRIKGVRLIKYIKMNTKNFEIKVHPSYTLGISVYDLNHNYQSRIDYEQNMEISLPSSPMLIRVHIYKIPNTDNISIIPDVGIADISIIGKGVVV